MDRMNDAYAVSYIFRVWNELTTEEIADALGWTVEDVEFTFERYYERVAAWLKARKRYPTNEDIDSGDFTLEPFTGSHYDKYLRI